MVTIYEVESHENLKFHVANGAAIFTLLLRRRVAFLHRTATCRPLFKPRVSLLSTYRQSSCVSNFYRNFKVFIWLSLLHHLHHYLIIRHFTYGLFLYFYHSQPRATISLNRLTGWFSETDCVSCLAGSEFLNIIVIITAMLDLLIP